MRCKELLNNYKINLPIFEFDTKKYKNIGTDDRIVECLSNKLEEIDLLGKFIECENSLVLIAKNRVKKCSIKEKISFECFYEFIKAYNVAFGLMSPKEFGFTNNILTPQDMKIEKSLAAAFALNVLNSKKFHSFIKNQPISKDAIKLNEKFKNEIELLMLLWKLIKITEFEKSDSKLFFNLKLPEINCKNEINKLLNLNLSENEAKIFYLILKKLLKTSLKKPKIKFNEEILKWIYENKINTECINFLLNFGEIEAKKLDFVKNGCAFIINNLSKQNLHPSLIKLYKKHCEELYIEIKFD